MQTSAPGKLILSGEHAVVYGCPALVMAVNRHAVADVAPLPEATISLSAPDILGTDTRPLHALPSLRDTLDARHQSFIEGHLGIQSVVPDSRDLIFYTAAHLHHINPLSTGFSIRLTTDLPVGCGMGSSAAIIAATASALAQANGHPLHSDQLFHITQHVERLQHGRPSGVDAYIVTHGGFARFQNGQATPLDIQPAPFQLALTGVPASATGECVDHVRRTHGGDSALWTAFTETTEAFAAALVATSPQAINTAIRRNHALLCRIGVVPTPVQDFIAAIEQAGGSAKICGAGAVRGPAAGIVLIQASQDMAALCRQHGYRRL
jgi:mevalonate kinase